MLNISFKAAKDVTNISHANMLREASSKINMTDIVHGNSTDLPDACPNISITDFTLLPSIAFIIVAAIGIFLCTLGYRFIRTSTFIVSVTLTSNLVYIICCEVVASNLPPIVIAASSLVSGMLAGLVALLLLSCFGSRFVCCGAGFIFATYLLMLLRILVHFPMPVAHSLRESLGYYGDVESVYDDVNKTINDIYPGTSLGGQTDVDWSKIFPILVTLIMLAFGGCVMFIISFLKPKIALVLSTSITGSAMIGLAADFFTDRGSILTRIALDCLAIKASLVDHICSLENCCCCWMSWVILVSVPSLVVMAFLFQWHCSSAGLEHKLAKMGRECRMILLYTL